MRDKDLYAAILGIHSPWAVTGVDLEKEAEEVVVHIAHSGAALLCPECGAACAGYDTRKRRWRHLDTCQFRTLIEVEVPRVECGEHGVRQVRVPWGEPGSSFTALFEALVIDWLKEASISAVARLLRLSWDEVDGIMGRAVARGLARRKAQAPKRLGLDETACKRGHDYIAVVSDLDSGAVLYIADDRTQAGIEAYFQGLGAEACAGIEAVSMDMWKPFIAATMRHVQKPVDKICFDRFHVAMHLNQAVDKVRRQEHRELSAQGDMRLKHSKFLWLCGELFGEQRARFEELKHSALRAAKAWAIKEAATKLWCYTTRYWAMRAWALWLNWASHCKLQPVVRVASMVREHIYGIINAVVLKVTNARAESLNSRIQAIKRRACGFRNRTRFKNAIYFHLGKLDLYPEGLRATHTTS